MLSHSLFILDERRRRRDSFFPDLGRRTLYCNFLIMVLVTVPTLSHEAFLIKELSIHNTAVAGHVCTLGPTMSDSFIRYKPHVHVHNNSLGKFSTRAHTHVIKRSRIARERERNWKGPPFLEQGPTRESERKGPKFLRWEKRRHTTILQ